MIATKKFQPFKRRIRLLQAVEGAFAGLAVGLILGAIWAILDWRGVMYLEWRQLWVLLGVCAGIGAILFFFRRLDDLSVARSIDRRAQLKDRLGTSAELGGDSGSFGQLLADDADTHLEALKPRALYPIRLKRAYLLSVCGIGVVAGILFLSNSNFILPKEALATKEAMQKESKRLEELRKAIFDDATDKQSTSPELLALQKDLQRLQKDYDKAKIDPKEAMIRAEELSKKADELAKQAGQQSLDKVKQSESMLQKMQQAELQKAGLEKADMDAVNMEDAQFDQKMNSAQQNASAAKSKVDQLKQKLDGLKAKLNKPGLDANAKKDLENQIKQTEKDLADAMKQAEQAQKDLETMQLSKEARDSLKKIFDDPLWKKIQEEAKKIKENAEQGAKTGQPKLSKEERQKFQKEMEELLKKLANDDARKEYLEKLLEAIKKGCGT